jgi:hypothetical protein
MSGCFTVAVFSFIGLSLLPLSSQAQGGTIVATGTVIGLTSPINGVTNGSPVTITISFDPNHQNYLGLAQPGIEFGVNLGWTNAIYETVNGKTTLLTGFIVSLTPNDMDPNRGLADALNISFTLTNFEDYGISIYYPMGNLGFFPYAYSLPTLLNQGLTGSYAGDAVIWLTTGGEAQLNTFVFNPGPALGLSQSGPNLVVSVPTNLPPGFALESSPGPLGANAAWTSVAIPPVNNTISIPITNSSAFFRLRSTN